MGTAVTLTAKSDAGQPLFVEFVNTLHWYEGGPIELIGTQADLAVWLAEHALTVANAADCLPALLALREHTRALIEAIATGQLPAAADLAALSAALGAPAGRLVFRHITAGQRQLAFEFDGDDDRALPALRIALSVASFLESGEHHRLKLCANPGCGFAFLDTSTNGTRRWCFMRYCGNRFKLRAFRRRQTDKLLSQPAGGVARPWSPGPRESRPASSA